MPTFYVFVELKGYGLNLLMSSLLLCFKVTIPYPFDIQFIKCNSLKYKYYSLRHNPFIMEKPCKNSLENYGVNIKYLWHISYSIKPWHNVVMDGFDKGLTLGWWNM